MSELEIKIAGASLLVVLLIIKKIISSKNNFKKVNNIFTALLFIIVIAFLSYEFISREFYKGLVAVGMGAAAFGKVIYDLNS